MAKVLITEKINPIGIEVIKNAGHEVIQMETLEESELKEKIKDVDAALVRILPITREILGGAKNLKILSNMVSVWTILTSRQPRTWNCLDDNSGCQWKICCRAYIRADDEPCEEYSSSIRRVQENRICGEEL